eukprot:COSAG01_NODE_1483_length_10158_cov_38.218290_13_plen_253_part_00
MAWRVVMCRDVIFHMNGGVQVSRDPAFPGAARKWPPYHLRNITIIIGNMDGLRFTYVFENRSAYLCHTEQVLLQHPSASGGGGHGWRRCPSEWRHQPHKAARRLLRRRATVTHTTCMPMHLPAAMHGRRGAAKPHASAIACLTITYTYDSVCWGAGVVAHADTLMSCGGCSVAAMESVGTVYLIPARVYYSSSVSGGGANDSSLRVEHFPTAFTEHFPVVHAAVRRGLAIHRRPPPRCCCPRRALRSPHNGC